MILHFGKQSEGKLQTVHNDLRLVMREALSMNLMDFTITEGHRVKEKQDEYSNSDPPKSKVQWPNSKHNKIPAEAVDAAPWIKDHISYDHRHCCMLAGIILTSAKYLGVTVRWGGNWDMDFEPVTDQDFQDLVHYEIVR